MATEVGKGFVEVVADLDKFGASVTKGMSGQQAAFAKSGTDAGKTFSTGVEKEISGKQSIFSKLGAQQGGLFGTAMSGAIAGGALAGGAAIGAFAVKAVGDFQKTALAADKFRDTTGLALDQSSRWIAVADDVGVGAGTIESAFKRMETSIDKNRTAFGDLIVTTASGATDLSATFLNVIEHVQGIEDPIARANESTKLFGRGFGEVSEIITTDADKLRESLEGVSEAQIIDEDEVTKARDFEAAMDNLKDTVGDVTLALGELIIGPLTKLTNIASKGIEILIDIKEKTGGGDVPWWQSLPDLIGTLWEGVETGKPPWELWSESADDAKNKIEGVTDAAGGAVGPFSTMATAGMSAAESQRRLNESFGDFEGRAAGLGTAMEEYTTATEAADQATKDLTASVLGLVGGEHEIRAAQQEVIEATERANEVNADASATTLEKSIADDKAVESSIKLAQANYDQVAATGDADGTQLAFISTLEYLAASASPAVKAQLEGVIAKLKETGEQHPEPTATFDDQASGPIRTLQERIAGLDGTSASIVVRAATADAAAALDGIISRANRINGMRIVAGVGSGLAEGIRNFKGGIALVGEEGPEIVHIPRGSDVYTNAESKALMSSRAAIFAAGGIGPRNPIVIVNQGTFLGTEEAFGKLADRAIAQARRSGHRVAA